MALRIASRQARLVVFGYNAVTKIIEWARNPEDNNTRVNHFP